MRFPLALTAKIAGHILKHKWRGTPKFALVLQLEPLHTCNLTCTGCGRIREYSTSLKDMMSLEDCLAAAQECDAPMVSICGGEPLIYPKIEELVNGLLAQGRIVYICTNGVFMRRKLRDYLAATYTPARETLLQELLAEKLISDKDAETIRQGKKDGKPVIAPTQWLYWNVHIDGLEYTHDLIVEREGVFKECVEAIKMAKRLGFQVATNTTVYRETDVREIEQMFAFFSWLGVDGHTISPGYDYDAAKKDMIQRLGKKPEDFFLTRAMTKEKFARILEWGEKYTIFGTRVYQEFLAGKRELTCTAWAIPTRNIAGWKAPCYLMTDGHYQTYQEMLEKVDWDKYGTVNGVARDPRCENCMVHCGYDPSGALGTNYQPGDNWKNIKYNFGPKPKPDPEGAKVQAFNGASVGKGHLAEARLALKEGKGGKITVQPAGDCGSPDHRQREELLAKMGRKEA
ncbi:adenosyl-hopene transferase HpnH [Fontisphaera persica]|uniref:adenosyl-hopene transferase HpnH n=1 Tax=Fontisphaera persica TaxID=2974023 RepID=UPI0024C07A0D|nr:adenosyl-hopene transferase HpnH [Fontisphaera persica]WCJ58162.1 adenosyl-hopene transferase HpnH [Fontisphaera persica]